MEVVRRSEAKPACPLHLKRSGPSSDVDSAERGAPLRPGPSASSSSSVAQTFAALQRGKVARDCKRVCGVPCNVWAARDQDTQQNAAVDGAVLIAKEEAAHWDHRMAIHASARAAISAALTAAAARKAAAAHERPEAGVAAQEAAAAREARAAQEAITKEEAEMKALEQALAQDSARKEAEIGAQADAAKRKAIQTARPKVAEEKATTKADIRALEAEKARLQEQRERGVAGTHKEAKKHAAEATAAPMKEAERKIQCETPPGASRADTL